MKVNLGCGKLKLAGWTNVDRIPGADVFWDVTNGLPFVTSSVEEVSSTDFLEHIAPQFSVPLINEIWRILIPGGRMEHYIPNAGSRNDFGSPSHLSHWNLQCFEHFDVDSYRWEKDREHEGFIGGFKKELAERVNIQLEEDGVMRAQSIHVVYIAVKPIGF